MNEQFFQILNEAAAAASNRRLRPEFPGEVWVDMGVGRVLEASESGRAFLQEHGLRFEKQPNVGACFASLKSQRRRDPAREIRQHVLLRAEARVADRLAGIPELARYACFAVRRLMQLYAAL